MFKKLHNYIVRCPVVQSSETKKQIRERFKAAPPCCVIAIDQSGAPAGVYLNLCKLDLQTDVLVLDKASSQSEHVQALAGTPPKRLAYGALMVYEGQLAGWVPPEVLTSWLGKNARAALKKAERETAAADSARAQSLLFLANMSHELRTPLNAIIGYTDLIREGTFGDVKPTQYGQYIDSIHLSGQHLLNAINSVLNFARVDAGVVELDEQELDLADLIDQSIDMIRTQANALNVKIVRSIAEDFPSIYADPQLLRQALLNLLSNAVKFSPKGTKVRVSVARTARSGARITVGDCGPGIPSGEISQILLPFAQASHGPGRTGVGTGLGLSLTKAFIELHEGRLHLLSEEGHGTRAVLTIPSGRVLDDRNGYQHGFAFTRQDTAAQSQTA
ncbi:MAG: HAMP domain-containing sensor histidine kinase [Pseudomonadota bacterium]